MKFITYILIVLNLSTCLAQDDYDADSVRYTSIPKSKHALNKNITNTNQEKVQYFFNVQVGSLVGCNDCGNGKDFTFTASTQHGVLIGRKLRTSLGFGFDSYVNWQMLPVFASASWDLIGNRNSNALFLQLNYGGAHPWFIRNGQYSYFATDPFTSIEGGRMINTQLGYRLKYHNLMLALSAGYKYQQIYYKAFTYNNCPTCDFPQSFDVKQDMNRFQMSVTIGWK